MKDKITVEERLERIERLILIGAKEVLDAREVAIMLNLSEERVRHLVCARDIPFYRNDRKKICFRKSEIESWQTQTKVPTNAEIEARAATYTTLNPKY